MREPSYYNDFLQSAGSLLIERADPADSIVGDPQNPIPDLQCKITSDLPDPLYNVNYNVEHIDEREGILVLVLQLDCDPDTAPRRINRVADSYGIAVDRIDSTRNPGEIEIRCKANSQTPVNGFVSRLADLGIGRSVQNAFIPESFQSFVDMYASQQFSAGEMPVVHMEGSTWRIVGEPDMPDARGSFIQVRPDFAHHPGRDKLVPLEKAYKIFGPQLRESMDEVYEGPWFEVTWGGPNKDENRVEFVKTREDAEKSIKVVMRKLGLRRADFKVTLYSESLEEANTHLTYTTPSGRSIVASVENKIVHVWAEGVNYDEHADAIREALQNDFAVRADMARTEDNTLIIVVRDHGVFEDDRELRRHIIRVIGNAVGEEIEGYCSESLNESDNGDFYRRMKKVTGQIKECPECQGDMHFEKDHGRGVDSYHCTQCDVRYKAESMWSRFEKQCLAEGIEVVDRYTALGIEPPTPETVCKGHCEGTGYVPISGCDFDPPLWDGCKDIEVCSTCKETDERFRTLWLEAQEENACDNIGYHFVKCPDCGGTGKLEGHGSVWDTQGNVTSQRMVTTDELSQMAEQEKPEKEVVTVKLNQSTVSMLDRWLQATQQQFDIEVHSVEQGDSATEAKITLTPGTTNSVAQLGNRLAATRLGNITGTQAESTVITTPLMAFVAHHTPLTMDDCESFVEFVHTAGFGAHEDIGRYFLLYDEWPGRAHAGPVLVPYLGEQTIKVSTVRMGEWERMESEDAIYEMLARAGEGVSRELGRDVFIEADNLKQVEQDFEDDFERGVGDLFHSDFSATIHDRNTEDEVGTCTVTATWEVVDIDHAELDKLQVRITSMQRESLTERGQYRDAPYPKAERGFPPEGASRDSKEWHDWAVNYAYYILTRNVFNANEVAYMKGETGRDPQGIPDEIWQEAYRFMQKRGLDIEIKRGRSAEPFVSRQESTMNEDREADALNRAEELLAGGRGMKVVGIAAILQREFRMSEPWAREILNNVLLRLGGGFMPDWISDAEMRYLNEATMEGKKFVSITLDENSDLVAVRGQVNAAITEGSKVLIKVGHQSMNRVVNEYRGQDGVQVVESRMSELDAQLRGIMDQLGPRPAWVEVEPTDNGALVTAKWDEEFDVKQMQRKLDKAVRQLPSGLLKDYGVGLGEQWGLTGTVATVEIDWSRMGESVQERGDVSFRAIEKGEHGDTIYTDNPKVEAMKYMAMLQQRGIRYTSTEHGDGAITVTPDRDASQITYQRESIEEDFGHNLVVQWPNGEYEGFRGLGSGERAAIEAAMAKARRKQRDFSLGDFRVVPYKEYQRLDRDTQATLAQDWKQSGRAFPEAVEEAAKGELLWMRIGNMGSYHHHDQDMDAAAGHLAESLGLSIKSGDWSVQEMMDTINWRNGGLEVGLYDGQNYVSLFWGDEDADMERDLDRKEQTAFVKALRKALTEYEK